MKTKFNGILTLLLAFVVQFAFAQKTVSGTVSDKTGPLPGVSVLIKGTTTGTETNFDGKYVIQVNTGDVLQFSFIGMETVSKTVGEPSIINVLMSVSAENILEEVVVTAQGIKKEKKALGYAVTQVSQEELETKPQADVARLLQGKSPGVRITSTGGVSGSGTNIIIRGYSSMQGSNQPLFVVDGVPFDSSTSKNNSSFLTNSNSASRFMDIDPNNIESLSVLKGLSATALYGEEGKNGVILITTKSGQNSKSRSEVTVNSSFFFNEIVLPDYQNTWGNGFFNDYGPYFSNWGSRFDSQETIPNSYAIMIANKFDGAKPSDLFPGRTDLDVLDIPYQAYDSADEYFKTGHLATTSVNMSGVVGKGYYSLNYGFSDDVSFLPGNKFTRNSFSVGGGTSLTNGFKISAKMNYTKSDKVAPVTDASFGSDVVDSGIGSVWNVLYFPRSVDLMNYPFEHPVTHESLTYRTGNDRTNPLWIAKYSSDDTRANRFFGNANVKYELAKGMSLGYRFGLDYYSDLGLRGVHRGANDGNYLNGYLYTRNTQNSLYDHSLLFDLDKDLTDALNVTINSGANLKANVRKSIGTWSERQLSNAFGYFNHSMFEETNGGNGLSEEVNKAIYTTLALGYKRYAYLSLSGRNDWSSVFQKDNRSIFSYGASISLIPTSAIEGLKGSHILNYMKLRVGYGQAPGFAGPYATIANLGVSSEAFVFDGVTYPSNYISSFLPNPDLKPELSKEIEAGIEVKFLNNRIGIDFTYYDKDTNDQINYRTIPSETGYRTFADNFGSVNNKGYEIGYTLVPFANKEGFIWDINGSFNKNDNIVTDTNGETIHLAGYTDLGNFAIEDEPYGVIMGYAVERDANGNMIVGDDGNYVQAAEPEIIGNPNPDWTTSLVNSFSYKGLKLSFQLEYQQGGDMYARTIGTLLARGLTTDTDFDRYQTFILPGVNETTGLPNDVQIAATDAYFDNYGFGPSEFNIYDMTHFRVREVNLSYSLNKRLTDKTPFGNITIGLQAYNVYVNAFNTPEGVNYDPDLNSFGVGNGQGFDLLTSWNSRRYGMNIKLTF